MLARHQAPDATLRASARGDRCAGCVMWMATARPPRRGRITMRPMLRWMERGRHEGQERMPEGHGRTRVPVRPGTAPLCHVGSERRRLSVVGHAVEPPGGRVESLEENGLAGRFDARRLVTHSAFFSVTRRGKRSGHGGETGRGPPMNPDVLHQIDRERRRAGNLAIACIREAGEAWRTPGSSTSGRPPWAPRSATSRARRSRARGTSRSAGFNEAINAAFRTRDAVIGKRRAGERCGPAVRSVKQAWRARMSRSQRIESVRRKQPCQAIRELFRREASRT